MESASADAGAPPMSQSGGGDVNYFSQDLGTILRLQYRHRKLRPGRNRQLRHRHDADRHDGRHGRVLRRPGDDERIRRRRLQRRPRISLDELPDRMPRAPAGWTASACGPTARTPTPAISSRKSAFRTNRSANCGTSGPTATSPSANNEQVGPFKATNQIGFDGNSLWDSYQGHGRPLVLFGRTRNCPSARRRTRCLGICRPLFRRQRRRRQRRLPRGLPRLRLPRLALAICRQRRRSFQDQCNVFDRLVRRPHTHQLPACLRHSRPVPRTGYAQRLRSAVA